MFICYFGKLKWYKSFSIDFLLAALLTWDQALFSFRFENYIPAGKTKISAVAVRENVWEPLKLGLISGYSFIYQKADAVLATFLGAGEGDVLATDSCR